MNHSWSRKGAAAGVFASTSARLHLGFLDMSGTLGRRFGSLGLSIRAFHTTLELRSSEAVAARGPGARRAA